jgi:SAM-dependent methyltransferase
MPQRWIDTSQLNINTLLLLEKVQLTWLPGWLPEDELGTVLLAHPHVDWFMRTKCPQIVPWVDGVLAKAQPAPDSAGLRQAEIAILKSIADLAVYALDPARYDAQPFLGWDDRELTSVLDFNGKVVVDIGAGTGRLAFTVAPLARAVFAVEPVANLRDYLREKSRRLGFDNVYPVDGLIEAIPFPADFADVAVAGHVFGGVPQQELAEMTRVVRPGGWIVLCPGNNDADNNEHRLLLEHGFSWSCFEEPGDGIKRKYWKRLA